MGDVVNLRQVRKAKAREVDAKDAADNRIRFGRSGSERRQAEAEKTIAEARLDGHRLGAEEKTPR